MESVCDICDGRNIVWYVENELWNEVVGSPAGIYCPICFVEAAEKKGIKPTAWRLSKEGDCSEVDELRIRIDKLQTEIEKLKKGENDWWQKRWANNDMGKQLAEVRKKWLTAYQCAENYQRMFEQLQIQTEIEKLKKAIGVYLETVCSRCRNLVTVPELVVANCNNCRTREACPAKGEICNDYSRDEGIK